MSDTIKTETPPRVPVELIGQNGNAFAILALCRRAAKKGGWTDAQWDAVSEEMRSGDYNELLQTAMKYFDVG